MKSSLIAAALFFLIIARITAQSFNSVPVDNEGLYRLLEIAEISGLIDRLPSARPLPLGVVKKALRRMEDSRADLSPWQRAVLDDYVERYADDEDESMLQDGDLRFRDDTFPLTWGFYTENDFKIDAANRSYWGSHNILGGIFAGDLGRNISYGFNINAQLNKVVIDPNAPYPYAWEPYTYTKVWDGGARFLEEPSPQYLMPRSLALGWALYPEMSFSFHDSRVNLRFARLRRDWGTGTGNLFLDKQARPFFGIEGTLSPWKFLNFSFLFGVLEYGPIFRNSPFVTGKYPKTKGGNNYGMGIQDISRVQQNMLSIFQLEIAPTRWLYISLFDAVVYLQRPELGYMFPFMARLLHQNNTGDFDNLMFGTTLALSWPGLLRAYGTLYLDEWNPKIPLNSLRNQAAFQAGIKVTLPLDIFSLFTFQYTKIEPFTYTHYVVSSSPWYYAPPTSEYGGLQMETGYQNNGENLGSYLEPNSDEFLLSFHVQPARAWSAGFTYRLIRHGTEPDAGGTYRSWGYFNPEINNDKRSRADTDPEGAYREGASGKNFLKDGAYEWFHVFSLGGSLDLKGLSLPVRLALQYSFVYKYETDFSRHGHFNPVGDDRTFRHLVGLNLKIFAK